jgi:hypothetical protein
MLTLNGKENDRFPFFSFLQMAITGTIQLTRHKLVNTLSLANKGYGTHSVRQPSYELLAKESQMATSGRRRLETTPSNHRKMFFDVCLRTSVNLTAQPSTCQISGSIGSSVALSGLAALES